MAEGHLVPTAHLADSNVLELEKIVNPQETYERDVHWINESNLVIAEVSAPSHGVGYEIAFALNLGKPVLCLYQKGVTVSKMITGNSSKTIQVFEYANLDSAKTAIKNFIEIHSHL